MYVPPRAPGPRSSGAYIKSNVRATRESTSITPITGSYPNSLANSFGRLPAGARSCHGGLVIARREGLFVSKSHEGLDSVATGSLFVRSDTPGFVHEREDNTFHW